MKFRWSAGTVMLVAIASCGPQRQPQEPTNNASAPVLPAPSAPPAVANSAAPAEAPRPGSRGGLQDDRTPLAQPSGPIDPRSAEAAGQVVQHYAALIEQNRFGEAEQLWGDAETARRATEAIKAAANAHLQIGKPTDMEGAAGSSYITVPVLLYGKRTGGAAFHRAGNVTLRRVNDVPGSTEAQRRWHIERIEWGAS